MRLPPARSLLVIALLLAGLANVHALVLSVRAHARFRESAFATVRARVTGNLGIYHLQACRSYPGLTRPDRWFCSEEDAQAAGFRRAYNCRSPAKSK